MSGLQAQRRHYSCYSSTFILLIDDRSHRLFSNLFFKHIFLFVSTHFSKFYKQITRIINDNFLKGQFFVHKLHPVVRIVQKNVSSKISKEMKPLRVQLRFLAFKTFRQTLFSAHLVPSRTIPPNAMFSTFRKALLNIFIFKITNIRLP